MGSLERRLEALEACLSPPEKQRNLSPEALGRLSDEDLDALEDVLEDALEDALRRGTQRVTFEELYTVASEKSRWAMDAYFDAVEAWRAESWSRDRRGTRRIKSPRTDTASGSIGSSERKEPR